jgi:hypothetical protein
LDCDTKKQPPALRLRPGVEGIGRPVAVLSRRINHARQPRENLPTIKPAQVIQVTSGAILYKGQFER